MRYTGNISLCTAESVRTEKILGKKIEYNSCYSE